ncbi:glycine cleavage system protein GcvH [Dolichospermum circinale CS-534/05]|uniref:glycine cleavage system protein GcvH n=1 Tax=Dolichospermum circinale TaxID=109265 RepID=UPI00232ABF38|nr:glycine cleavage system protein GcvH [Dolichospermum circinale]MDB9455996.1 glycine cleavage system protein GcvH [Dolichospermum circinale CS-541/06]MDB9461373.1 glycine cleavage system protein GcvH [Dolichospermum circinale CS-541/04]MDB9489039.1 glycine cleavage system protein GcvH [Dolichospermum circinale CS-534/05]MDB9549673.1 glycine cleavage system protein GcvH [Dolichospermum circinale CS-1031]
MSSEYPQDLRYLDSHEYVRLDDDIATIGITQFAIEQLGDIVFLELPDTGDTITKGDTFGTIESVKAVETLNSPVSGTVIESNEALLNNPEQVADDPYGEGWFIKVRVNDAAEIDDSLTAEQYQTLVEGM